MKIKETIKNRKGLIDKALLEYIGKYADKKNLLYPAVKYALFPGGKRIRAVLCLEACAASGGKINNAVPAACSIELIHNFSLVHDDLPSMDDDDFRRGKLSCHKKYGQANAILAGDAVSVLAFEVLQDINDAKVLKKLISVLSRCTGLYGMIGGQAIDIKYDGKNKTQALKDKINTLKTAELFVAAIVMGGISAKANSREIKALENYGRYFGKAFQLRDDILDKEYARKKLNFRKEELKAIVEKAKSCLEIFGAKAHNLIEIVELLKL